MSNLVARDARALARAQHEVREARDAGDPDALAAAEERLAELTEELHEEGPAVSDTDVKDDTEQPPVEALMADADATPSPNVSGTPVRLKTDSGDAMIAVPRSGKWRTRALQAMRMGDFETWAGQTLGPADYHAWVELDPTLDDVQDFFVAWGKATGEQVGKLSTSQRG